jgi:hypothetical protein
MQTRMMMRMTLQKERVVPQGKGRRTITPGHGQTSVRLQVHSFNPPLHTLLLLLLLLLMPPRLKQQPHDLQIGGVLVQRVL